eukprot:NODE_95_length_21460_cov_0.300220.p10 type:complete len:244 gc:universal NODE_95_length_21460_cov_0.300220:9138-9869(+)
MQGEPERDWYLNTLESTQQEILEQLDVILSYFSRDVKLAISTEFASGYLGIKNNLVMSGEIVLSKKGKAKVSLNKEIPYSIIQIENIIKYIIMAGDSLSSTQHFVMALEQIDKMSRMIRRTRQQLYFRDPAKSFAASVFRQDSFIEKEHIVDLNLNENKLVVNIYHLKKGALSSQHTLDEYQDVYRIFKKVIQPHQGHKHLVEIDDCIEFEVDHPPMKQILERILVVEQLIRECIYNLQCFKK